MKYLIFKTDNNLAPTILRVVLGLVILIHGFGKLGEGFETFMGYLTGYLGLPAILGYLTIIIETLGSLLLILGVATRVNAGIMFGLFVGMIITVHAPLGFMMNWFGQMQAGQEGYEYHILVLAMCGALVLQGGGRFSVDKMIVR
ncbi:MAG: DoxX family protein [Cyclobacteriaceae bacterium]|nr:DoxX family protein [Cyclobacteriaceae bacterium HetDA_MAG_MS6]